MPSVGLEDGVVGGASESSEKGDDDDDDEGGLLCWCTFGTTVCAMPVLW